MKKKNWITFGIIVVIIALIVYWISQYQVMQKTSNTDVGNITENVIEETQNEQNDNDFYSTTGSHLEDAQEYLGQFLTAVEASDKSTVVTMISYPREVTTTTATYSIENKEEMLGIYDEVFTDETVHILTMEMSRELFAHDGFIGAGDGEIWMAVADGQLCIETIQLENGISVRYNGTYGVQGE